MDQSLCKITIVGPPAGADRIIELMLRHEPVISGFTTWDAEGHGYSFDEASVREKVHGRVARQIITAVLEESAANMLAEKIVREAPFPHLSFWIEPVLKFGRIVRVAEGANVAEVR